MQAYSITYEQALDMTLPQILMSSHAAECNYHRGQKRFEWKKKREEERKKAEEKDPFIAAVGKRMSDMTTDEQLRFVILGREKES